MQDAHAWFALTGAGTSQLEGKNLVLYSQTASNNSGCATAILVKEHAHILPWLALTCVDLSCSLLVVSLGSWVEVEHVPREPITARNGSLGLHYPGEPNNLHLSDSPVTQRTNSVGNTLGTPLKLQIKSTKPI